MSWRKVLSWKRIKEEPRYDWFLEAVNRSANNSDLGEIIADILRDDADSHDSGMGEESWQWFYNNERDARSALQKLRHAGFTSRRVSLHHQIGEETERIG